MYRYQILIEYVGTSFVGWQIQKKGKSIQKTVQSILSKLLKEKIILFGSGRTDAGVHAMEQSAHFDLKNEIQNIDKTIKSLNFFLNDKMISIIKIKKKNINFHARYSAKERVYVYYIQNRISPSTLNKDREWHIRKKLDINLIKKGSKKLIGTHDFSSFRASNCGAKSPVKTINKIIVSKSKNCIKLKFKSKSFLKNQVRSMVGCLKYLGEKKWDLKKFENVLIKKDRKNVAPPAPACGLYLEKIIY
jgi:tRNA pseudouridine38-40 synthase|tara:strand:+ start:3398 stop:4138 length:741 start_codon:yes stop_codon:yes gene_type:complete